jgi:hypothetical protein
VPHQNIAVLVPHQAARASYRTPRLERFGTFREITQEGVQRDLDGGLILGPTARPHPPATTWSSGLALTDA